MEGLGTGKQGFGLLVRISHHTLSLADMVFVFLAEQFNAARNRTGGRVSKGTEGLAADIIAYVHQEIDIALTAVPMFNAFQDFGQPVGTFTARSTFAARFVAVELCHAQDGPYDTGIFVHDNDSTGAKHRASGCDSFKVERRV